MFTDLGGAIHELGLSHLFSATGSQVHLNDACNFSNYREYDSGSDDLFYRAALVNPFLTADNPAPMSEGAITTAGPDGTVYTFDPNQSWYCKDPNGLPNNGFPSSITDRNGNSVTIAASPLAQCNILKITDTLGRTAISAPFATTGTSNVTAAGLSQPYKLTWGTGSSSYTFSAHQVQTDPNCGMISGAGNAGINVGASNVASSIQLPNGQDYQFAYETTYGQIRKITYPTGGYVSYTWGLNPLASIIQFDDSNGAVGACIFTYDVPAVMKRFVSFDGTTQALEQDFSYSTTWGTGSQPYYWTQKTTTVVTKDSDSGNQLHDRLYLFSYNKPLGSQYRLSELF